MFDPSSDVYSTDAIGIVVDTNDPQQMGRIRARVASYGDTIYDAVEQLPWCMYVSPFGGMIQTDSFTRGPDASGADSTKSIGPVAYGMFNIPKPGALVIVSCIDGDPMTRIWKGCIFVEQTTHTLPHGRYFYDPDLLQSKGYSTPGKPEGPLTTSEDKIQPLYNNQTRAFGGRNNFEWRTRGADHSATGLTKGWSNLNNFISEKTEDEDFQFSEPDGNTIISRDGYRTSRLEPDLKFQSTDKNYDPQVYCWVTPGFHGISMDDSDVNCRMRFRSSTGHQIILDDTNERIYISTNLGENWIEMDSDGSIDVYSSQKISLHSVNDINITSDNTIRMYSQRGIHMYSKGDIRMETKENMQVKIEKNYTKKVMKNIGIYAEEQYRLQAKKSMYIWSLEGELGIRTKQDLNLKSEQNVLLDSQQDISVRSGGKIKLQTGNEIDILCGAALKVQSQGNMMLTSSSATYILSSGIMALQASGTLNLTGSAIVHTAGAISMPLLRVAVPVVTGSVSAATPAQAANPTQPNMSQNIFAPAVPELTFWTNRIPAHEPWGRVSTLNDFTHQPKVGYNESQNGREFRSRGPNWHR